MDSASGGAGKVDETGAGMVENTREAIGAAQAAGFCYVETDVTDTSDGVAVHYHGNKKARKIIRHTSYDKLNTPSIHEQLGFVGLRIPRLVDTLDEFRDMRFFIDQKTDSVPKPVAWAIKAAKAQDRVSIDGASWRRTVQTRKLLDGYDISTTIGPLGLAALYVEARKTPGYKTLRERYLHGATSLSLPIGMVGPQMMEIAHKLQIPTFLYRIKTEADVRRAEEYGARGVMIDNLALRLRLGGPAVLSVMSVSPRPKHAA